MSSSMHDAVDVDEDYEDADLDEIEDLDSEAADNDLDGFIDDETPVVTATSGANARNANGSGTLGTAAGIITNPAVLQSPMSKAMAKAMARPLASIRPAVDRHQDEDDSDQPQGITWKFHVPLDPINGGTIVSFHELQHEYLDRLTSNLLEGGGTEGLSAVGSATGKVVDGVPGNIVTGGPSTSTSASNNLQVIELDHPYNADLESENDEEEGSDADQEQEQGHEEDFEVNVRKRRRRQQADDYDLQDDFIDDADLLFPDDLMSNDGYVHYEDVKQYGFFVWKGVVHGVDEFEEALELPEQRPKLPPIIASLSEKDVSKLSQTLLENAEENANGDDQAGEDNPDGTENVNANNDQDMEDAESPSEEMQSQVSQTNLASTPSRTFPLVPFQISEEEVFSEHPGFTGSTHESASEDIEEDIVITSVNGVPVERPKSRENSRENSPKNKEATQKNGTPGTKTTVTRPNHDHPKLSEISGPMSSTASRSGTNSPMGEDDYAPVTSQSRYFKKDPLPSSVTAIIERIAQLVKANDFTVEKAEKRFPDVLRPLVYQAARTYVFDIHKNSQGIDDNFVNHLQSVLWYKRSTIKKFVNKEILPERIVWKEQELNGMYKELKERILKAWKETKLKLENSSPSQNLIPTKIAPPETQNISQTQSSAKTTVQIVPHSPARSAVQAQGDDTSGPASPSRTRKFLWTERIRQLIYLIITTSIEIGEIRKELLAIQGDKTKVSESSCRREATKLILEMFPVESGVNKNDLSSQYNSWKKKVEKGKEKKEGEANVDTNQDKGPSSVQKQQVQQTPQTQATEQPSQTQMQTTEKAGVKVKPPSSDKLKERKKSTTSSNTSKKKAQTPPQNEQPSQTQIPRQANSGPASPSRPPAPTQTASDPKVLAAAAKPPSSSKTSSSARPKTLGPINLDSTSSDRDDLMTRLIRRKSRSVSPSLGEEDDDADAPGKVPESVIPVAPNEKSRRSKSKSLGSPGRIRSQTPADLNEASGKSVAASMGVPTEPSKSEEKEKRRKKKSSVGVDEQAGDSGKKRKKTDNSGAGKEQSAKSKKAKLSRPATDNASVSVSSVDAESLSASSSISLNGGTSTALGTNAPTTLPTVILRPPNSNTSPPTSAGAFGSLDLANDGPFGLVGAVREAAITLSSPSTHASTTPQLISPTKSRIKSPPVSAFYGETRESVDGNDVSNVDARGTEGQGSGFSMNFISGLTRRFGGGR